MKPNSILDALIFLAQAERVAILQKFFKTGKGDYAEGDLFLGVCVPDARKVAKEFSKNISREDLQEAIQSKFHEMRLVALLILVEKFEKSKSIEEKHSLVDFYLENTCYINNWDLVDSSCYKILGSYCFEINDTQILEKLSSSENMWEKRMAVVGSLYFIKKKKFNLTLSLILQNINHPHDLMHKANGWMMREIGKQDEVVMLDFLKLHYLEMPRTCLRYAIEKLDETLRQDFLKGRI